MRVQSDPLPSSRTRSLVLSLLMLTSALSAAILPSVAAVEYTESEIPGGDAGDNTSSAMSLEEFDASYTGTLNGTDMADCFYVWLMDGDSFTFRLNTSGTMNVTFMHYNGSVISGPHNLSMSMMNITTVTSATFNGSGYVYFCIEGSGTWWLEMIHTNSNPHVEAHGVGISAKDEFPSGGNAIFNVTSMNLEMNSSYVIKWTLYNMSNYSEVANGTLNATGGLLNWSMLPDGEYELELVLCEDMGGNWSDIFWGYTYFWMGNAGLPGYVYGWLNTSYIEAGESFNVTAESYDLEGGNNTYWLEWWIEDANGTVVDNGTWMAANGTFTVTSNLSNGSYDVYVELWCNDGGANDSFIGDFWSMLQVGSMSQGSPSVSVYLYYTMLNSGDWQFADISAYDTGMMGTWWVLWWLINTDTNMTEDSGNTTSTFTSLNWSMLADGNYELKAHLVEDGGGSSNVVDSDQASFSIGGGTHTGGVDLDMGTDAGGDSSSAMWLYGNSIEGEGALDWNDTADWFAVNLGVGDIIDVWLNRTGLRLVDDRGNTVANGTSDGNGGETLDFEVMDPGQQQNPPSGHHTGPMTFYVVVEDTGVQMFTMYYLEIDITRPFGLNFEPCHGCTVSTGWTYLEWGVMGGGGNFTYGVTVSDSTSQVVVSDSGVFDDQMHSNSSYVNLSAGVYTFTFWADNGTNFTHNGSFTVVDFLLKIWCGPECYRDTHGDIEINWGWDFGQPQGNITFEWELYDDNWTQIDNGTTMNQRADLGQLDEGDYYFEVHAYDDNGTWVASTSADLYVESRGPPQQTGDASFSGTITAPMYNSSMCDPIMVMIIDAFEFWSMFGSTGGGGGDGAGPVYGNRTNGTGAYLAGNAPAGTYIVAAQTECDAPSGDKIELLGVHGWTGHNDWMNTTNVTLTNFTETMDVNITFFLPPPSTGNASMSGHVTWDDYNSMHCGDGELLMWRPRDFQDRLAGLPTGPVAFRELSAPGAYNFSDLPTGDFIVQVIFECDDDNGTFYEGWGVYGGILNPQSVTLGAAIPVMGVNITLQTDRDDEGEGEDPFEQFAVEPQHMELTFEQDPTNAMNGTVRVVMMMHFDNMFRGFIDKELGNDDGMIDAIEAAAFIAFMQQNMGRDNHENGSGDDGPSCPPVSFDGMPLGMPTDEGLTFDNVAGTVPAAAGMGADVRLRFGCVWDVTGLSGASHTIVIGESDDNETMDLNATMLIYDTMGWNVTSVNASNGKVYMPFSQGLPGSSTTLTGMRANYTSTEVLGELTIVYTSTGGSTGQNVPPMCNVLLDGTAVMNGTTVTTGTTTTHVVDLSCMDADGDIISGSIGMGTVAPVTGMDTGTLNLSSTITTPAQAGPVTITVTWGDSMHSMMWTLTLDVTTTGNNGTGNNGTGNNGTGNNGTGNNGTGNNGTGNGGTNSVPTCTFVWNYIGELATVDDQVIQVAAGSGRVDLQLAPGDFEFAGRCVDADGDDVTVTLTYDGVPRTGTAAGSAEAEWDVSIPASLVGNSVELTLDWTDGTDSGTYTLSIDVISEEDAIAEASSGGFVPGFGGALAMVGLLAAVLALALRRESDDE